MARYEVGRRVRLTAPMRNEHSSRIPVEEGMPVGLEGTIVYLSLDGPAEWQQIGVEWDNGRSLGLLPGIDRFIVLPKNKEGSA